MLHVTLLCSDQDCAELIEAEVDSLDQLDGMNCECRYGLVLLRVAELAPV
jgi:hypothetical protein